MRETEEREREGAQQRLHGYNVMRHKTAIAMTANDPERTPRRTQRECGKRGAVNDVRNERCLW